VNLLSAAYQVGGQTQGGALCLTPMLVSSLPTTPHIVTSRRNHNTLLLSSLAPPRRFSLLSEEEASSPLTSSLSSSLESLCPPPDHHHPLLPLPGCPKLCRLVEQSCRQLGENGGSQILLLTSAQI